MSPALSTTAEHICASRPSVTRATVHRYANAADSGYRYAVLSTSTPEEWRHHAARGQESNRHRRHARYRLCHHLPRQETADAAVEKLTAVYPDAKVWGRSCDLTSLEAVTEAFTQAAADMGGLDTVVNNAGISQRSPLLDYTAEEFAKVMDLNVVAVFNGHQAAAKIMTEAGHGGTITTTSSMVAKYGQPSGVGYPTSKFAVNGMVQSLSRELAPMGIRVNAVAPGVTKTDMVANLPEEVIKPIIATIPLGRMGEPEDVANAFVFLASDMSSYVTGAILPVDGAARS